jgi:hypothetical protein
MQKISRKKSILLGFVSAFMVIGIWFAYQMMHPTKHLGAGGGVYDQITGKFYSPDEMQKLNKERGLIK